MTISHPIGVGLNVVSGKQHGICVDHFIEDMERGMESSDLTPWISPTAEQLRHVLLKQ
jgi:hypothetical protein